MTTEPKNLHYLIPVDALRTREWLQHGIESLDSDKALKRFTAFIDEVAVAFFCALNTCSYAALTIVEPLADLIKAHPVDAFNSVGRNLVKAIGSFAGIFFGLYMAGGALFASHKFMKHYTPINPKTLKEEKEELEQTKAELEATIAASDQAKEALEQQLAQANENAGTFEQTKTDLEARIATSNQTKEALEQQLAQANENAGTFEQTIAVLEARITESDRAKEALEQQLEEATRNAETFEQTKTDLEARIATSDRAKEALEQQLAEATRNAGTFEQTIADLEARIATSDQAKEALEQQLEEATRNAETLEQTKTDLEAKVAALNGDENLKVQVLKQHITIYNLKLEIKKFKKLIDQISADNKDEKLSEVINIFNNTHGQNMLSSVHRGSEDEYHPDQNEQNNDSVIQKLEWKKELLKAQLDYLETSELNEDKLVNKARFGSPGYSDPYEGHNLTVHLNDIARRIGKRTLSSESLGGCKLAKALTNKMRLSPKKRYGDFVNALREVCVSSLPMNKRKELYNGCSTSHGQSNADYWLSLPYNPMSDFQKQVLLIHMSGVDDSDFLKKLTDRILDLIPSDDRDISNPLKSLIETNKAVHDAPSLFLTNKSAGKLEGAIGTKDFLGVDGGNVPNVRGDIQFTNKTVTFLRAPTPSLPNYENSCLKNFLGLGNALVSHFYDPNNGNGELLAPEEAAFCQLLEESEKSMLVAVHECLGGVERGRCLLRAKLEKLSSSYLALFQPYDGDLYDKVAGDGTFTAMKETLKKAYCHNNVNNPPYGCLLPLTIRNKTELLEEYKVEIDKLVDYVQKVYFKGSDTITLDFEIPHGLDKSEHYDKDLMAQRAFLHFFYIAQSEHMMVWLNDKLEGKELSYFKSQCKDAQDRTGMEAIVQEAQYAMRNLSGDELSEATDRIIKKNIGQCIANKGLAFHGKRFILGAIVFGYLLENFKDGLPDAFNNCEHLPDNEKITGMKVEQNATNQSELTYKNASSFDTYLNALKLHYHQNVRPLSRKGCSQKQDEFEWTSIDSLELGDVGTTSLPHDLIYSFNGDINAGTRDQIEASIIDDDKHDILRYMSKEASGRLLSVMKEELNNTDLSLEFTETSRMDRIYHYRKVDGMDRMVVLEMPITISQRGRDTNKADCKAYLQVNLSSLKRKRIQNGAYAPSVPPIRWTWRLKDVDNQSPTEKALGIKS